MSKNFEVDFDTYCRGQTKCDKPFYMSSYVDPSNPSCVSSSTRIYWQIFCTQTISEVNDKRGDGLIVVSIGIFISAIYLLFVSYLSSTAYIDYKLWDVGTVTAADFTVEFDIAP